MRNKIKDFIDKKGITVYRFHKDTGIANRTAYDLYNDPKHLPTPRTLEAICHTYKVQPGILLEWIPEERELERQK